jgi:hypothetical protein
VNKVERGLKLIAAGNITVEMVQNGKPGKISPLPKLINQATGKVSKQAISFNEVIWGKRCMSYVKSAKGLSSSRFDEIVEISTGFMKNTNRIMEGDHEIIEIDDEEDIRANVVDISSDSDSDSDCKSSSISYKTADTHRLFRDA